MKWALVMFFVVKNFMGGGHVVPNEQIYPTQNACFRALETMKFTAGDGAAYCKPTDEPSPVEEPQ